MVATTDNRAHQNFSDDLVEGLPLYYNFSLQNMVVLQDLDLSNTYGAIVCALCSNVSYVNVTIG